MGSRYYDPGLGRFLQPDTLIPDPGSTLDWDRYAYARSNPIVYNDPSGHWPEWFDWAMGAACQYANDISLGTFSAVSGDLDNNESEAFQNGRQTGRVASTIVASVSEVEGAAVAGAAAAGVLPTSGVSLAAAPETCGGSLVVGGVVVGGEVVVGAAGAATSIYGAGVIVYSKSNPVSSKTSKLNPSESKVWKGFDNYKGKTKTSGSGRDQHFYQWDYTHGDIEVYDRNGQHLGSMDPNTGKMYKDPVPGRKLDK